MEVIACVPFSKNYLDLGNGVIGLPYRFQLRMLFFAWTLTWGLPWVKRSFRYVASVPLYFLFAFAIVFLDLHKEALVCVYLVLALLLFVLGRNPFKLPHPTQKALNGFVLRGTLTDLPINKPEEGIFILGAPGSGKTRFAMEPLLEVAIAQGRSGIVYDYDFSLKQGKDRCLTQFAYNA